MGPVRVPREAGKGMAKIGVTFDGWKDGQVVPGMFKVPIMER
jgi:hypothetical protein